jgi:hypothetical protein
LAQNRGCGNLRRWSWTVIPDGEVTVNESVYVCVLSSVYGPVVDLVVETVADAIDVRVFELSQAVRKDP